MNNALKIEEVFSGRLLCIPSYQRGYAWEDRQLSDFLEDLEFLGKEKDHYTGTLVLHKSDTQSYMDKEGKNYSVFDVVDGQQRLTTVILLLYAISLEISSFNHFQALADGIKKNYVSVKDMNNQPLYKLKLNPDSHNYFIKNIISENPSPEGPSIASHRRLLDAKKTFSNYLSKKKHALGAAYKEWLLEFHRKVTQQLKLSLYNVSDTSEVGVIFEVMNDRGKPLSELEKVKNYLLYLSSKLELPEHNLEQEVNNTWSKMFERLMSADLVRSAEENQILRAHWLMTNDPNSRSWNGSKTVKDHFRLKNYHGQHKRLLNELKKYVHSLGDASLAYIEAMRPSLTNAFKSFTENSDIRGKVVHLSQKLRRTRIIAPFLPLLIAMRLKYPDNAYYYLNLVELCEKFAFRVYLFTGRRADAGQSTLFRLGNQLYNNEKTIDEVLDELRATTLYYCSSHDFKSGFALDDVENDWYSWNRGIKYFLYEYEAHLAKLKGEDVVLPWETIENREMKETIEHILPQTPKHEYWTSKFDSKARKKLTHDIGNLSLTHQNSSYKNKPFPDKKGKISTDTPCYANSSLFMERNLCSFRNWTPYNVIRRRNEIIKWALERWHVKGPKKGVIDIQDDIDEFHVDAE